MTEMSSFRDLESRRYWLRVKRLNIIAVERRVDALLLNDVHAKEIAMSAAEAFDAHANAVPPAVVQIIESFYAHPEHVRPAARCRKRAPRKLIRNGGIFGR